MLRSWITVGALFLAGIVVTLRMQDANWFFIILFGGMLMLWLLDRTVFADRNRRERAAQKRFFGLDE